MVSVVLHQGLYRRVSYVAHACLPCPLQYSRSDGTACTRRVLSVLNAQLCTKCILNAHVSCFSRLPSAAPLHLAVRALQSGEQSGAAPIAWVQRLIRVEASHRVQVRRACPRPQSRRPERAMRHAIEPCPYVRFLAVHLAGPMSRPVSIRMDMHMPHCMCMPITAALR